MYTMSGNAVRINLQLKPRQPCSVQLYKIPILWQHISTNVQDKIVCVLLQLHLKLYKTSQYSYSYIRTVLRVCASLPPHAAD